MKTKLLLSALLGMAAWSFSGVATADWDTGACPGGGSAPCIETEINGNTYHFNGTGGHAGIWHGRPAAEGGGDFVFEGDDVALACTIDLECTLALSGQVKKCQDANGAWRIGVKVTDADVSNGLFCGSVNVGGFPWYSKDATIASHCPFEDDCDSFIPYDANASSYTGNFGTIDVDVFGIDLVSSEHVHSVVFTPGVGANFAFASDFYDCDDNASCSINGVLTVNNATSLDIQ
ncbi:MAG: hypothetical protein CL549_13150 [Alcanivorax sp.]|nr:hypothetical protein [Alcanivorax sp.]MAY11412.1 hypothetical protein [Alcanivorax sp.]MBI53661.1 hypothetical protein [Alcanivorax sp.]|tara:strand:+ start:286 stop:984 length:699 start_codon:yes stop_codon:yes gene_type:complete